MIRVKLVEEDKRRRFEDITRALSVAYNENRAVLVTNNDEFVCAYIPDHQDYTIQINDEGIEPIYGEFVNFKNERYFDWKDCVFEVIDIDRINITITRN